MTKSQLIEQVAKQAPHLPRQMVEALVNAVFDTLGDALKANKRIEVRGFGSFQVRSRQPREGRNPKTGERVSVPERRTLAFTVGKELKARLNGEEQEALAPDAARKVA